MTTIKEEAPYKLLYKRMPINGISWLNQKVV